METILRDFGASSEFPSVPQDQGYAEMRFADGEMFGFYLSSCGDDGHGFSANGFAVGEGGQLLELQVWQGVGVRLLHHDIGTSGVPRTSFSTFTQGIPQDGVPYTNFWLAGGSSIDGESAATASEMGVLGAQWYQENVGPMPETTRLLTDDEVLKMNAALEPAFVRLASQRRAVNVETLLIRCGYDPTQESGD